LRHSVEQATATLTLYGTADMVQSSRQDSDSQLQISSRHKLGRQYYNVIQFFLNDAVNKPIKQSTDQNIHASDIHMVDTV